MEASTTKPIHIDCHTCKEGDPVWALRGGNNFHAGTIATIAQETIRTPQMSLMITFGNKSGSFKYAFDCYVRDPNLNGSDRPPARNWRK